MGMELEIGSGDRINLQEDIYPGACVQVIDLGTQVHPKYGKKRRLAIGFYIAGAVDEDGEEIDGPVIKYRQLAARITKKTDLGKLLKKWLGIEIEPGEKFDLDELLEQAGQIDIVHSEEDDDGNKWDNIDRVTRSKEKVKIPKDVEVFSLYLDDTFDEDLYELVPDFLKDKIEESPEWRKLGMGKSSKGKRKPADDDEDEDEDEKPKRRGKRPEPEEEEEDEKPKRRGKKSEPEEKDEKPRRKRKPFDEEEDEDEDEKPKRRGKKSEPEEDDEDEKPKRRGKKSEPEEEEEEEDEEDEKPRRRKTTEKPKRRGR